MAKNGLVDRCSLRQQKRMLKRALVSLSIFAMAGCDAGSSSSSTGTPGDATPQTLKGCAVDASISSKVAPGGYYTHGASVCTASGEPHLFHGVDRPSLEWDPAGEWNNSGGIARSDFDAMASWHANVVRIALNQDYWLSNAALYVSSYEATVDRAVKDAEGAGLDVILDLHWSDRGNLGAAISGSGQGQMGHADQQQMADQNSLQFWHEVARKYKDDGHVLFELYNEPHDIPWSTWLNGGQVGEYQAVGMQNLYDAVRAEGANNLVIAGGVGWAFDLSRVQAGSIAGYNIMYATHPYAPQDPQMQWDGKFGYLAAQDIAPVIATEFGDGSKTCTGDWDTALVQYADARQISWTAWAWWPGTCSFPSLISDWKYTPTVQGAAIKAALLNYTYEPAGIPSPAPGSAGAGPQGGAGGGASGGAGGASGGSTSSTSGSSAGGASGASGASGGNAGGASGANAGADAGGGAVGGASGSAGTAGDSTGYAGASGGGGLGGAAGGNGGAGG
jgi:aryl-phospho-beta-D-glucosidase BglC (GH1 family)